MGEDRHDARTADSLIGESIRYRLYCMYEQVVCVNVRAHRYIMCSREFCINTVIWNNYNDPGGSLRVGVLPGKLPDRRRVSGK